MYRTGRVGKLRGDQPDLRKAFEYIKKCADGLNHINRVKPSRSMPEHIVKRERDISAQANYNLGIIYLQGPLMGLVPGQDYTDPEKNAIAC